MNPFTSIDFVSMNQELLDICETESQRERVSRWLRKYVRREAKHGYVSRRELLTGEPKIIENRIRHQLATELLDSNLFTFDKDHISDRVRFTLRAHVIAKPRKFDELGSFR